jgi:rod shape-determining protein MreD
LSYQARKLDPLRWLGLPAVACVLATVLFATPIRVFGLQLPEPIFAMAPAFAWAVIRPSLLAPLVLLALGLFLDLLWGGPLGLWPLSMLVGYAGVLVARNMMTGQSWTVLWSWFALTTFVVMGVGYLLSMLKSGAAPSFLAVFLQFLPTVLLYPFAHRLIERFEDADVRFR